MTLTAAMTFINLPVKNIQTTNEFFKQLGFEFNAQFSNENTTCMIINPNTFVMLLEEAVFQGFIKKEIADASRSTEVLLGLSAESRAHVDEIVNKALAAGGKPANDPVDHGFMYGWSFQDPDNHIWEVFYMDPGAVEG